MITIACAIMMLIFMFIRTSKLFSASDPFFTMTAQALEDTNEFIDLWELGFMFAVEDIDPRIGRVEVSHSSWFRNNEANDKYTPIKMVPCSELAPGGA